jgi:hypothetical protein
MPKRLLLIPGQRLLSFVDRHQKVIMACLMFALLIALGFAVAGWTAARNAEQRVSKLELTAKQTAAVAQVATCFSAARSRPPLTTILRALASGEHDPAVRAAYDQLITDYSTSPTPGINGEPTIERCTALADKLDVDPSSYIH